MNKKAKVGFLVLTLLLVGIVLFQGDDHTAAAPTESAAYSHIVEYTIPRNAARPGPIAVESPGRIWIVM